MSGITTDITYTYPKLNTYAYVNIYREYRLDLGYKSILGGGTLITS